MSAGRFRSYWQSVRPHIPFQKGSASRKELIHFAAVFGVVCLFTDHVIGLTICVGPSMLPTLDSNGELALIDRISYNGLFKKEYEVGDVVISVSMDDPKKTVCKRVRAKAGDIVYYVSKNGAPNVVRIPMGHVWLLGDNASNSNDSRYYGAVPLGLLQGRVFAKIGTVPYFHVSHIDTVLRPEKLKIAEKELDVQEAEKLPVSKESVAQDVEATVEIKTDE